MKILFVGHQASPGGAQNVAYRIMQGLKSRGHEIVLAFPEMGPEVMRARDAGFETHIVPVLCWHYMKGLDNPPCGIGAYLEKFTERVDRWCRELEEVKPDLIYVNTAVIIEPVIAAAMCGVPRVWHIQELFGRDADIQGSGFGDAAKLLMALPCTRILAASDAVSCELTSMVAGAAVDVVRYGLPAKNNVRKSQQDKVRGGCNSRNPVVLFAGEFSYRKGLDVLFCAIPFVLDSHPDVCFSFAGGDSRGRLDAEINRLPESYRDKIKLLGFCADMSSVYCSADMLVLPSRGDPFPTVVIESMAAGLPVVGTRSGGMEEQIVDGSTGLLVDVDDAQQLAEAIKSLLADPERCQAMGRAAYARVTKNFTEEKMLDAVERSLKKAVRASCADESELVPQLRVLIDFVALREREHRSEIDQLQARLESVESDLRRIMDLPPVRLARFTKRILKGEKQPQPAKAAPRHGVVYFAKKKSWEWLEMMRWKLAFRFGEPAESILSVMPGLQKLSAKLLAGKASRGKSTSKEKNIYFSPIYSSLMVAPFTEDDKRLLQSLERRRSGLSEKYIERDQSILVSVVMPTYNRSHLLQRALRSLCAQSYQNWEVIVVDDGGADDTKQVIDTFADKRIRYIRHDERRGVSAARNTALSSAQGEYIAYLDSDNEWESDYLLLMLNALRERNGMRAIYCAEAIYSDGAELEGIRFAEFQYSILLHRNYIDLNVFLHHRDLYDEHGGFNETLRRLVDWDLILRYARHAVPLALPCVLVKYYQGRSAKRITDREGYWKNLKRIQSIQSADKLGLANYPAGVDAEDMYSLPSSGEPRKVGRRVSIVIPSYGVLDCLKTCVEAIQKFTPAEAYELVIFDNASDAGVREYLCELESAGQAKVQLCDQNMGFTFAVNEGIRMAAPGNDIVLLNNDAIVTAGWLEEFTETVRQLPAAGLLAPQQVLLPFTPTMKIHVPFCLPFREVDVTISAHHDNLISPRLLPEKGYQELSFVNFFCVYITRECLDDTGLLNEEDGRHYKSDKLFCDKILSRGHYKIVYTPYCKVYHLLQQSTHALKRKNRREYKSMFVKNEWSGDAERLRRSLRSGEQMQNQEDVTVTGGER